MKSLVWFSILLVSYFFYGFVINQYDLYVVPRQLKLENPSGYYDYKGIINVHTNLSSGTGSHQFILQTARALNFDFILFTDINQFEGQLNDFDYNGTLSLFGAKYRYLDSRLIYYSQNNIQLGSNLGDVQVSMADLLTKQNSENKNQILYLAHPFNAGFNWTGEIPTGMDGMEVLNLKSVANRAWSRSKFSTLWSLAIYPFNSRLALMRLFHEPEDELNMYDNITSKRHFVAYAGSEASARAIPLQNYIVNFPSYQRTFEMLSNHVLLKSELTGNLQNDRNKIFTALKNGNFYLALDFIGDPKGFNTVIEDKGRNHLMGSSLKFNNQLKIKTVLAYEPKYSFEVVVYKNGQRVFTSHSVQSEYTPTEPGAYRVQVRVSPHWPFPDGKRWVSWIYANPFFLTP